MKNLLVLFIALFLTTFVNAQIVDIKVNKNSGDSTKPIELISLEEYNVSDMESCDLYFKHNPNTNWIMLDDTGRDVLLHMLKKDKEQGMKVHQYLKYARRKYHKPRDGVSHLLHPKRHG